MMDNLPCVVCQKGDPFSNIICSDCEEHQGWLKKLNEMMEQLVRINNDILGHIPCDIDDKIRCEVNKIWDQLYNLKIEGKERCH
jgi:hypothetical protein